MLSTERLEPIRSHAAQALIQQGITVQAIPSPKTKASRNGLVHASWRFSISQLGRSSRERSSFLGSEGQLPRSQASALRCPPSRCCCSGVSRPQTHANVANTPVRKNGKRRAAVRSSRLCRALLLPPAFFAACYHASRSTRSGRKPHRSSSAVWALPPRS